MANYILDIILIAIIIFCVAFSAKKGFIGASKSIIALLLTLVLMTTMQGVMLEFLQSTKIGDSVKTTVSKNITKTYEKEQLPQDANTADTQTAVMICESLSLPSFLEKGVQSTLTEMAEIKNNVLEVITDYITLLVLRILALLLLYILVRIFVFIVLKILESLFTLPGLRTLNRGLGMAIGILNSLIIIYILCGAVALFTPMDSLAGIKDMVDATYLVKYFYNNNFLLSLFV